jgi:two-component system chemotaxis sensor kinase CheA
MAPLAGNRSGSSSPERAMHFSKSNILRVDFERLDHLLNLAGEMVLQKTKLNRAVQLAEEKAGGEEWFELLAEAAQEVEKTTGELQETIMRVRMLPVRQLFQRFPRMVRDLAHRKGKEIDVTFEGEGTEIDKTVIDALSDPFMHLIRNAVDHGIELPDARRAKGKRPVGSIHLAARQEANHIVISVRDDGAGMDIGRILAKARDRGLIGADQALSEEEITALIFQPGFSTAETVTETSGRGVGLDVVRKVIADFNGLIEARTAAGEGSEFILKMPLTLAIIPALLVEVAGVIYAIPRSAVLESVKCEPGDVHAVDGSEVTSLRGSILTVKHLSRLLGMPDRDEQDGYLVIVGYAEKRVALKVDRLKGQQDVVIKSLGSYVGDTLGIAGATVLGDGRVVLIIDAARLV